MSYIFYGGLKSPLDVSNYIHQPLTDFLRDILFTFLSNVCCYVYKIRPTRMTGQKCTFSEHGDKAYQIGMKSVTSFR